MDAGKLKDAIAKLRQGSKKRNFMQTVDVIFLLKGFDKSDKVDLFVDLHNKSSKKVKVCALVGAELADQAKKVCDMTITQDRFAEYASNKKEVKKLCKQYDYFIAQANIMADIAKVFGRVLGPRNKMPNPKAGCVVPPSANLKVLYDKLQSRIRLMSNKNQNMIVFCSVGTEDMKDEQIIENIITAFNALIASLPNHSNNYKKTYVKLTMSPAVEVC